MDVEYMCHIIMCFLFAFIRGTQEGFADQRGTVLVFLPGMGTRSFVEMRQHVGSHPCALALFFLWLTGFSLVQQSNALVHSLASWASKAVTPSLVFV